MTLSSLNQFFRFLFLLFFRGGRDVRNQWKGSQGDCCFSYSFKIDLDTSGFSSYSDRGRITQVKQPKSFEFSSLKESWENYQVSFCLLHFHFFLNILSFIGSLFSDSDSDFLLFFRRMEKPWQWILWKIWPLNLSFIFIIRYSLSFSPHLKSLSLTTFLPFHF